MKAVFHLFCFTNYSNIKQSIRLITKKIKNKGRERNAAAVVVVHFALLRLYSITRKKNFKELKSFFLKIFYFTILISLKGIHFNFFFSVFSLSACFRSLFFEKKKIISVLLLVYICIYISTIENVLCHILSKKK